MTPDHGYPTPTVDLFMQFAPITPFLAILIGWNMRPILDLLAYLIGNK